MNEHIFREACRYLSRKEISQDSHGNISMLVPPDIGERGLPIYGRRACDADGVMTMFIKPSGAEYAELPDPVVVNFWRMSDGLVDFSVEQGEERNPSVDTVHHATIYMNNPRIGAICHTHSTHATAFAMNCLPISVHCTEHADYFGKQIKCQSYENFEEWGNELQIDDDERAILLTDHGVLTFGFIDSKNPLADAAKNAVVLEEIAHKTQVAMSIAKYSRLPLVRMCQPEVQLWHDRFRKVYGQRR